MKRQILQFTALILGFIGAVINSGYAQQAAGNTKSPSSWSIVASYTLTGKASGLAWDGTYIYYGQYWTTSGHVYKFDPASGTSTLQCTGPFEETYGLTYKSPNLVTVNQPSNSGQPSEALEFTMAGSQVSTITLPDHYMSGIAYDNGDYWVCTYYPDPGLVYHINNAGTVLSQFVPPNNQPWDICLQGSDLWIADFNAGMLYKVTTTGTLLESHPSQGIDPAGIVFDGTYLWYCDGQLNGNSTLYKIDLQGSGTPVITVPVTSHDYGTVTIGNPQTWNCEVQNTGTANLVINAVNIPAGQGITTTFVTPATIAPGNSVNIPFIYTPSSAVPLNTQATIISSDPVHPQTVITLTGNCVYAGAHISIIDTSHDWSERRAGAYSRWLLPVKNNGDQPLILSAMSFSDPHFFLDDNVVLPVTVTTLQTKNLGIWFHPADGIAYAGTLGITSNDPTQNPFGIDLSGHGVDTLYPMGTVLWSYTISSSFDNSPKSIVPIPDITGDGVDDVIIGSDDDNIRCFNGNASVDGDVMWTTAINAGSVYEQNGMAIINDIDNDGYKDVIAGTTGGDESITAFSGKTGLQIWKHDTHEYGGGGWVYQVDVSYDYNNDGFPDVLASTGDDGNGTGPRRVYCLDGKTGGTIWETPCGGAVFSVIGVEDFNGDGQPDAVAGATTADQNHGRVFGIDGSNGAILWTYIPAGSSVWALMQVDDVNGDGIKDVAVGDFNGNIYLLDATNGSKITSISLTNDLILRFENMGDVNKDGYRDILVGHSVANGLVLSGHDLSTIWSKHTADKAWTVTNVGDVTWDGTNDAAVGTLYVNNDFYFMNGVNGNILFSAPTGEPVDAIGAIPDIVGDHSKELIVGGRNGTVLCVSGGYDSATISVPGKQDLLSQKVNVYPNPCRDELNIRMILPRESNVKITLTDITGRVEFSRDFGLISAGPGTIRIERAQILQGKSIKGIHLLGIETRERSYHFKIVFE